MTEPFTIEWAGAGRKAKCAPNPAYPDGMALDASRGAAAACIAALPYPAPECGTHLVRCGICGVSVAVTAAGRPDDPKTVKVACRISARA